MKLTSVSLVLVGRGNSADVLAFFNCLGVLVGVGSRSLLSAEAEAASSVWGSKSSAASWSCHFCSIGLSWRSREITPQHLRQTRNERCGVSFTVNPSLDNSDAKLPSFLSNNNLELVSFPSILKFPKQSLQLSLTSMFTIFQHLHHDS